jgi:hypothetical protein
MTTPHTSPSPALQRHIEKMHAQRQEIFSFLETLPPEVIWQRPAPKEWSVGENLDHMRVIYRSMFPLVAASWYLFLPLAWLMRRRPYRPYIDDVYRRPGFPDKVGWIWPPRYTPERPASLETLRQLMEVTHRQVEQFYSRRPADLLGNIKVYDPAIGWLNLIQVLQVGVYHDALHIEQIHQTLGQINVFPQEKFHVRR